MRSKVRRWLKSVAPGQLHAVEPTNGFHHGRSGVRTVACALEPEGWVRESREAISGRAPGLIRGMVLTIALLLSRSCGDESSLEARATCRPCGRPAACGMIYSWRLTRGEEMCVRSSQTPVMPRSCHAMTGNNDGLSVGPYEKGDLKSPSPQFQLRRGTMGTSAGVTRAAMTFCARRGVFTLRR
jgi:hypothetical protein